MLCIKTFVFHAALQPLTMFHIFYMIKYDWTMHFKSFFSERVTSLMTWPIRWLCFVHIKFCPLLLYVSDKRLRPETCGDVRSKAKGATAGVWTVFLHTASLPFSLSLFSEKMPAGQPLYIFLQIPKGMLVQERPLCYSLREQKRKKKEKEKERVVGGYTAKKGDNDT